MNTATISISLPPTFNFEECLWFLNRDYDDCLHVIEEGKIFKAIRLEDVHYLICISIQQTDLPVLSVIILTGNPSEAEKELIRAYIVEWFDLDRNILPFYTLLASDPQLSYMQEDFYGLHMTGMPDLFEALCWGIIGQQINLTFAYRLKRRLVEKYGASIEYDNRLYYLFPTPSILACAEPDDLRAMQLSGSKIRYLLEIATLFQEQKLSKKILSDLPDFEARQKLLLSVRGVGTWTANYVLMKCLKDQHAVPFGDAGLVAALYKHGIIPDKKDKQSIESFFVRMKGWEAYTVFYLWRSLAQKPGN